MALKLALLQMDTHWHDKRANLEQASEYINRVDADLCLLPEMFTTGFTMSVSSLAETMDGQTVAWFRHSAQVSGKAIMGSVVVVETDANGAPHYFNRLIFASPNSEIQYYDKKHLFRMGAENNVFTAGNQRVIINYGGFRIMPIICYDLRFPVWCRNRGDYDLMVDVACWPRVRSGVWSTLLRARAIENLAYVAGVNMVGDDPELEYSGDSAIIDFLGQPLAESTQAKAQALCATLDMDKLNAFRQKFPAHLDADAFTLESEKQ